MKTEIGHVIYNKMTGQLIVLTGKSGSGKSSMAKRLCEHINVHNHIIIDQDSYWSNTPPTVSYENRDVKLYDSVDAIVWDALCEDLVGALKKHEYVIFTAFLIPPEKFQDLFASASSICAFEFDISDKISIERRRQSKAALYAARGKPFDPKLDKWMVRLYTAPLYKSWIKSFRKKYHPTLIGAEFPEDMVWSIFMNIFSL